MGQGGAGIGSEQQGPGGHLGGPDSALGRQYGRGTGDDCGGNEGAAIHPGAGQGGKNHAWDYSPAIGGDSLHRARQRRGIRYKPGGKIIEAQG